MKKYILEELCSVITDGTHQTPEYSEEGYVFLSSKDVTTRKINWENTKKIPKQLHETLSVRLKPQINDILLAKNGTTGVAAIVDRDEIFDIYVSLALLRPREMVYPKYLLYAVNSPQAKRQFDGGLKGIGVPNLHLNVIRKTKIPLPQLERQQEIVKRLEVVDKLIEIEKEQIAQYDVLIKSRFVEMFGNPISNSMGWKTILCKDATIKIGSGATPKGGSESYSTEGISLIRSMNVYHNRFEYKDLAYITDEQAEKLDNVTIEKKDVLLNITGASVARCCIVPEEILPARVNQHVSIIRCKEMLLPEFVCHMLTENNYQKQLWNIATSSGATREAITKQQIEELVFIVPPIELQEQFATFVHQVDKLKVAVQKSLTETQLLFESLMQQYFG